MKSQQTGDVGIFMECDLCKEKAYLKSDGYFHCIRCGAKFMNGQKKPVGFDKHFAEVLTKEEWLKELKDMGAPEIIIDDVKKSDNNRYAIIRREFENPLVLDSWRQ